jgi:hypothetical protein
VGVTHRAAPQRALIALVQVLSLAVWFSASAVVPALRAEWDMSAPAAVWLTASVQLGFATGAVASAAVNLADRFGILIGALTLGSAFGRHRHTAITSSVRLEATS